MAIFHHGYLLTGDTDKALKTAFKMASEIFGEDEKLLLSNPDFSFLKKELLTIEDARQIRENAARKSFFGKGRVFVMRAGSLSKEAANAFLKTFEEPTGLSYFFLIIFSLEDIPETLRSRLVVLRFEPKKELSAERRRFIDKFLSSPFPARIEMTKGIVLEKENAKEKTVGFLDGLEVVLRENLLKGFSEEKVNSLDELSKQRDFIFQRSSSLRMIIEHLCFVLPRI